MSNMHNGGNAQVPANDIKEVDYYLNPTELFRWINYRRWDGARARAQSHPEECNTWIVSRHNSDGRILWRHLPLHLVCMQREAASVAAEEDLNASVAARQIEALIDVLLDSYPEGASSPDDQGMLPLHLLMTKAENEPNDRVINLLLTSFPNAVDVQDKFGRTPYDILREQSKDGASERSRAAFRALKRARFVSDRISATIRDESATIVAAVQHEASNERSASQKIILRLEEELNNNRKQMDDQSHRNTEFQSEICHLSEQLVSVKVKLDNTNRNLEMTRKERDDLLSKNEYLDNRLKSHDKELENARLESEGKRQSDIDAIANLRSELNTSKAMAEALESQLRSRFTNEEYLSTTVSNLEEELEELRVRHEHSIKKAQQEVESINADNKRLKWSADEMGKKHANLQNKLNELSKQMATIISSHSALSSEHDRLVEISERHENNLLEAFRKERSKLVETFNEQRAALEKSFSEQERTIEESLKAEEFIIRKAKEDRMHGRGIIDKIRKEFQEIRTSAAERERQLHAAALAANRKLTRDTELENPSSASSSRNSHPGAPPPEVRNPLSQDHRSTHPKRVPQPRSSSVPRDGSFAEMLDDRATAQLNGSRRDPEAVLSGSSFVSSHRPYYIEENNSKSISGSMHRDRRNNYTLPTSASGVTYQTPPSNGEYSLDEYSNGSDEASTSSGPSDSSSYERQLNTRDYHGPMKMPQQYNNVRRDYGNHRGNLHRINESYGHDGAME